MFKSVEIYVTSVMNSKAKFEKVLKIGKKPNQTKVIYLLWIRYTINTAKPTFFHSLFDGTQSYLPALQTLEVPLDGADTADS